MHFSPLRKSSDIIGLHLESLKKINSENIEITYTFFDDNVDIQSSFLLGEFLDLIPNSRELKFKNIRDNGYCNKDRWSPTLYNRITSIKDEAIKYFLENNNFDYLFLTDADLVVHPQTLVALVGANKDFCTEIFWTRFESSSFCTPNAWYSKHGGFNEIDLIRLSKRGTYPVDYTGACTLLSRKLLETGVRFERITNIEYLGEDKHFCIRAAVMGFSAYCNTDYPAFHIYRENLLPKAKAILESNFKMNYTDEWLNDRWLDEISKSFKTSNLILLKRFLKKLLK
tara:strand:- start:5982 stop:6833 length:852 start_codon:yes stop_codon:yes gene_type:complete